MLPKVTGAQNWLKNHGNRPQLSFQNKDVYFIDNYCLFDIRNLIQTPRGHAHTSPSPPDCSDASASWNTLNCISESRMQAYISSSAVGGHISDKKAADEILIRHRIRFTGT